MNFHRRMRSLRAGFYRRLPFFEGDFHLKRLAGFERRWDLEGKGFTKAGFVEILRQKLLSKTEPGIFAELQAGDGLVGSLGAWLEQVEGWKGEAWEHRIKPLADLHKNRPKTAVHAGRLTEWNSGVSSLQPVLITTRGAREASGVCRAIRAGRIQPALVGIWNPTRRSVWQRRLRKAGYRLELVYHRMEFYRETGRTDSGGQMPDARGRRAENGGRMTDE